MSRPAVNRLLDEGRIPFHATPAGQSRIKRMDVEAYVANRGRVALLLTQERQSRRTHEEEAAAELGLTPEQSQRLGFS